MSHRRTFLELFLKPWKACGKVRLANTRTNKSSTVYNVNSYTMTIEANNKTRLLFIKCLLTCVMTKLDVTRHYWF